MDQASEHLECRARMENLNQEQCLKMGLKLAAIKLQHVGGLPEDLEAFYDKTH